MANSEAGRGKAVLVEKKKKKKHVDEEGGVTSQTAKEAG